MDVENGNWKEYLSPQEIETYVDIAATDFLNLPPNSPYGLSSFLVFPTHSGYAVNIPRSTQRDKFLLKSTTEEVTLFRTDVQEVKKWTTSPLNRPLLNKQLQELMMMKNILILSSLDRELLYWKRDR